MSFSARSGAWSLYLLCGILLPATAHAADLPSASRPIEIAPAQAPATVAFEKARVSDLRFAPAPVRNLSCYAGVFGEIVVSHPEVTNVPVAGAYSEYYALGDVVAVWPAATSCFRRRHSSASMCQQPMAGCRGSIS